MRKRKQIGEFKINCSKCNKELEDNRKGKYRYCKACHAEHMRKNRPKHSELSKESILKENCRSYTREYIKRGKLIKMNCCICGDEKSQVHHEDYNKPLEIVWYCREHHLEYHENKKQLLKGNYSYLKL